MSGYPSDLNLKVKLCPRTMNDVLALTSASEMNLTTVSKAWKPLPPGNVRLNGYDYANWPTNTTGDVTLSWNHRNRTMQGVNRALVRQDIVGSYTCEGVLKIEVLINGTVKRTWNNVGGISQVYTTAQHTADDPTGALEVKFRITPINGALQGTIRTTPGFIMGM